MPSPKTVQFYQDIIDVLQQNNLPFMIGGTYAFNTYMDMDRQTKDLDVITTKPTCHKILKLLRKKGIAAELLDPLWLGKIYHDEDFIDIIFAERNDTYHVTSKWFQLARQASVLDRNVLLMPLEYMISTKVYVQFREKFDGSDVNYLLLKHAPDIDWKVLTKQLDSHWQLLFTALLTFVFVFPSKRNTIPPWVIDTYLKKTQEFFSQPPLNRHVTQGHLISYEYSCAIDKWDYKPV